MVHEKNWSVGHCVEELCFLFGFGFWEGISVLSFQHVYLTHKSHRSCLATLSLDTVEDVSGGGVDELEEDVG